MLSACATNEAETLANSPMSGNEYQDKLAANYAELAKFEYDKMYDTTSAALFAKKGMAALKGQHVDPEKPEKWGIENKEMLGDLQGARTQLVNSLNRGAASKMPGASARALVSYDCWVEQSEEGWQYKDIAGCRDSFIRSMGVIDKGMIQTAAPAPAPVATSPQAPSDYLLFFDWNSAELNDGARTIIRTAVDNARRAGIARFELVGHADTSGPKDYNQRLSLQRANAVANALVQMGYGEDSFRMTGRGEQDPLVQTADGVREPQNRRVRITIMNRRVGT